MEQLRTQLASDHRDWGVTQIEMAGAGLDFMVFRAQSKAFGLIAIRIPKARWITNVNDPRIDSRDLLRQEAALTSHMLTFGVAVPKFHALIVNDDGLDLLITEYVDHDESTCDEFSLGEIVRLIHECPLPNVKLAAQTNASVGETIARRVNRRLRIVEGEIRRPLGPPALDEARTILKGLEHRCSVLHMDLRSGNILTRGGKIASLVDWGNALIGNPAIELARMTEYGSLTDDFLAGYGGSDWEDRLPKPLRLLLRLDAAAMLALVFLSEAPDPQRARSAVDRVALLCRKLTDAT